MRKNYLWYQFFRYGVMRPALNLFYSDIQVTGRQYIPEHKPVLFVANHQNSFLDALHVVNNTKHFVHFLTRAEAFGNPVLDRFFYSLNMLPVYRARDGFGTIRRNNEIFSDCFDRLYQKDAVLVFAEASHEMVRRVRPLSKGFTRIVFGAEEKYNWELDLQIVPVGINYGDHRKSQRPVHIKFGEAVPSVRYRDDFHEDEREAATKLKVDMAARLKELTLHVPNKQHYALYQLLLDELEPDRSILINPDKVNVRVSEIKQQLNGELVDESQQLLEKAEQHGISIKELVNPPRANLKDLLLSPLYGFSLVNNALPNLLVRWLVDSYLEDEAFESSVKFLVGLLLPVYYLLIGSIFIIGGLSWPWTLGYIITSLITARLFVRARDLLRSMVGEKKKRKQFLNGEGISEKLEKLRDIRKSLFGNTDQKS
ncbi:1-acyl-sn-glycerol-3-phosphate acyltransferase [Fodinibius sp. N2]|uniref:1-acyl-sn-glycerol-3-phosphate acyltransferase n=1 Tax=Fodinibius alkaliphilus TaxID=3140241 RepID=UPI00315A47C7